MIEFYPEVRLAHIYAVAASGSLFLLRGLALLFRARWSAAWPARYLGYAIDVALLTAALMLTTILEQYPFVEAWVTVKLALFVAYVVLGIVAFQEGRRREPRLGCWLAGLAAYGFAVTVATAHHPLGLMAPAG